MFQLIKKYWLEILTIGLIFGVLLIDCAPNMTWINTCSDGVHYTYSAENLLPSHKSSAPLYLLIAHLWVQMPIGTDFWRLAFMNVIIGTIGSWLIYAIVKRKTDNKWFGCIGAIVYGGSALAISQNTIVETYPMLTTAGIAAYYFADRSKWIWTSIMIGVAGAVHPLAMMFIVPLLFKYKELRQWKRLGIMALFVLFYLYIPITNRPPYMWHQPNSDGMLGFLTDTLQTSRMLSMGLSIWDLPKRVLDTVGQLVLNWNIGIVALIVLFWRTKWYKEILAWFIILPILYYVVNLAPQTYVYMQPAIAFGAVGIGIGLNKIWMWNGLRKIVKGGLVYGTAVISVGIMAFNCNYFDIGRTLDPELSATKFWNEELPKLKDGDILVAQLGWEWAMVYKYNNDMHKDIKVLCVGTLPSETYQDNLRKEGINVKDFPKVDLGNRPNAIAKWIVENNDNVWITKPTTPRTYGAEVLDGKSNIELLDDSYSPLSIVDGSRDLKWQLKPSNPYDITTGAIEVDEWKWIVFSNYNCLMFGMLVVIGYVPVWIVWNMIVKKKKWSASKVKQLKDVL